MLDSSAFNLTLSIGVSKQIESNTFNQRQSKVHTLLSSFHFKWNHMYRSKYALKCLD